MPQALLDAHSVSIGEGAIALHSDTGIPLRSLGTGSSRLLVAGLQRAAASAAPIALVDEVEYGLEPHRLMRFLDSLGAKDAAAPLQVFMTTHSPVALRERVADIVGREVLLPVAVLRTVRIRRELLDADGVHLRHGAAPTLPEPYVRVVDGIAIGQGVGSCGTAAATGRAVIVDDITRHPLWAPYATLAAVHGLCACWSFPILSRDGQVLGTLALYSLRVVKPTLAQLEQIRLATDGADIPWWRVVNASGRLPAHLLPDARRHWAGEGIDIEQDAAGVPLRRYRAEPQPWANRAGLTEEPG